MKSKLLFVVAASLLATVCMADTDWSGLRGTNDDRVAYRWRRLDFGGMTSNCEIEMTGPEKAYVKATATYLLRNETKSRPVSGYMSSGRTKDNIAGCDAVIEVVVDRFIP